MNILFLAPRLPWPADTGGKIRTINILKQLLSFSRLHLVCFSFESRDEEWKKEIEKLGARVTLVAMQEPSFFQKVGNVSFGAWPHSIIKYYSPLMKSVLEHMTKSESFDAVHIDHLHMAHYTGCFEGLPCFLDEHNVEYKILERCAQVESNLIKKILYKHQALKMESFEGQKAKKIKGVFACSPDDQMILEKLTPAKVDVIANGVDTEYFSGTAPSQIVSREDAIVFTGSMDWLPNDDAISYFCGNILPLIWQKKTSVKFYVVGKNPSTIVKDLAGRDQRVIVTGRVDDVRPYILRSKVFIVPLRIGGGTRLKILEAMAMGRAVVSTTIGAEGINHTDGKDILLADNPADFADKVLLLLNDEQRSKEIGLKARNLVCSQYDWNIIGQKLKTIYEEAIRAPQK